MGLYRYPFFITPLQGLKPRITLPPFTSVSRLRSSVFKLPSPVSSLSYHSPHSQLLLLSTRRLTAPCPLTIPAVPTPPQLSPVFLARRSFSVGGSLSHPSFQPSVSSLSYYLPITTYCLLLPLPNHLRNIAPHPIPQLPGLVDYILAISC